MAQIPRVVLHTPGHTPGSLTVLLEGGAALVGDLLMGGHLGGALAPRLPRHHYFAASLDAVRVSLARLLDLAPTQLYVGHGGPLAPSTVAHLAGGAAGVSPAPR